MRDRQPNCSAAAAKPQLGTCLHVLCLLPCYGHLPDRVVISPVPGAAIHVSAVLQAGQPLARDSSCTVGGGLSSAPPAGALQSCKQEVFGGQSAAANSAEAAAVAGTATA